MNPKISVIIPTYNRSSLILRAISSVVRQTYKDFELIIIDDGSTDNTREVVDDFFFKERLSHSQFRYYFIDNHGVSYARNIGYKFAKGEWLAFLDSDDEWLEDKLQKQIDCISKNPDVRIIHGEEIWIRNGVQVHQLKKHQKGGGDIFERSLALCLIGPSTVMIQKSLFFEIGGFREDFPVCEDYDLWLRITSLFDVGFVDQPLVKKYGGHEDQLSHKMKMMDYFRIVSMDDLLKKRVHLSEQKRMAVRAELLKKIEIVLEGMKKYNNWQFYEQIMKIKEDLKS